MGVSRTFPSDLAKLLVLLVLTKKKRAVGTRLVICHLTLYSLMAKENLRLYFLWFRNCHIVIWDVEKCEVLHRLVNEEDDSYVW